MIGHDDVVDEIVKHMHGLNEREKEAYKIRMNTMEQIVEVSSRYSLPTSKGNNGYKPK